MKKALIGSLAVMLSFAFYGDKAKNFRLKTLQNKDATLAEHLENGPVLIDFWATWCKPCIKAFPKLEKLHQKYKDRGFTVLAINTDSPRNQAKVKPFVKSLNVTFPILIDSKGDVMRDMGVQLLPTTILVSQEREILLKSIGFKPSKFAEIDAKIESELKKKAKASE